MRPERWLLLGLVACGGGDAPTSTSAKARVNPKSGEVWGRDLANGLGLQEHELCSELGLYDCLSDAHLVTLGGVEPAVLGINEPLPNAPVTAPMASERVAISACAERFDRDRRGDALVFGPVLDRDAEGRREEVARTLVERLLARRAEREEIRALVDLYAPVERRSKDPVRDWSVGACVVVATSTEALFY